MAAPAEIPALSMVVPALDEEENLAGLHGRVLEVFGHRIDWELLIVDDGSTDGTARMLLELQRKDARIRPILFERNHGQTTAIRIGIEAARAPLIATLDADLQNDPEDLPAMLDALGSHDAVVGYRVERRDGFVKQASSRIANSVRNRISGDRIRDTGCSLKVFRAEAIRSIPLFEGMHRFIPTLLRFHGYSVIEHPVSHHPRLAGKSKYGIRNRAWRGFKDLLAVRWMRSRIEQPRIRVEDTKRVDAP
jgi:dolichol-phosphate mannosyltransferase